jgi:PAS domain S-box-containing protein
MPVMTSLGQGLERLNAQLLVDSIPALIHTARPDGYLDYFNKPWLEYLGVTLDKVAGWNWTAYVHPEDVEGIVAKWRGCLATGEIFEYETRVRKANGDYRWMLHRKVPLRDANGSIVKWYGSSLDIDERKTAEEQLRRNAEELQRSECYLAEGQRLAHMGSWAFDLDGFYYWSHELFRMHGLDPAGNPPNLQEYLDGVHPQDRESIADLINGILAEASPFDATKRIMRPDGEVRYIRCVGAPVAENQNLKRYVGSAIDVTEHELLTQELRRREAYLTEAQRLSHTGSFGWSVSSGEILWSEETFRIYQCDPGMKPSVEFVLSQVHKEDRERVQQLIDRASRGGEGFDFEHRLQLPSGCIKHVRVTAHPSRDSLGNLEFVGAVTDVSEQRHTEAVIRERERELQENKVKLEEAQRVAHVGYWEWDLRTDHMTWSDETYRIYGLQPQERPMDLATIREFVHPEDREFVFQKAAEALEGEVRADVEHRIVRPSGEVRVVHSQGDLKRDAAGRPWQMFGTAEDITDRKRTEEALRLSETYLAEAQKLTRTGSWAWNVADRSAVHLSEEWYRIYGFDPAEGPPDWEKRLERVHPEDRLKWKGAIERAILEKADYEVDFRIALPGGIVKWIQGVGHPVLTAAGDLVQFLGSSTDITQSKEAEQKLHEQEMELRQVLDFTPQLVAVFGPNRERLYVNRVTLDYLGITIDEWRQRSFAAELHPDDAEQFNTYADRAFSGAAYELEMRLRKADGSYRWFLARYNPVRDNKGQVVRWYVACTDIEDRKQAEDRLRQENVALREEIDKASMFEEIVGTSPALQTVLSRISKVAPSHSTVLVTGETGTGKELVARAIHRRSDRSSRVFVSVNCAAIPRDLIASELFGHEKGAFTGATQQRLGRFELASGGTIFLDEVGELPAETQVALLRVLQEREFERVGGTRRIHADVRVIAATNRNLQAAISAGSFRSDLFYRLHVFPLEVPSLRERKEDIPLLVEYFIDRYARKVGKDIRRVNKKTLQLLQSYPWPGNIRELQNVIERSVILCETEIFSIDESWLPQQPLLTAEPKSQVELPRRLLVQEKDMIEAALKDTGGRVSGQTGAAVKLGIPRSTLESKIRSLKIDKNRYKI